MVLQPSNSARFEYISLIRTVHGKKKIPSWGISTRQQGNADLCPRTDYWVFTMCWALGIHKQRVKVSSPRYRQTVQKKRWLSYKVVDDTMEVYLCKKKWKEPETTRWRSNRLLGGTSAEWEFAKEQPNYVTRIRLCQWFFRSFFPIPLQLHHFFFPSLRPSMSISFSVI